MNKAILKLTGSGVVAVWLCLLLSGCGEEPAQKEEIKPPAPIVKEAHKKAPIEKRIEKPATGFAAKDAVDADKEKKFDIKDKDGDGKVSLAEFLGKRVGKSVARPRAMFEKKDKDGDGNLTKEEFSAAAGK